LPWPPATRPPATRLNGTGQPFRAKYLDQALAYLAAQPDIWLTTSDEIAEHYQRTLETPHRAMNHHHHMA
jgi:hypothetical protein